MANGFNIWNQTLAKWLPKLKETSFKEDSEVKQVFWRVVQSSLAKSQLLQKVIKYKFNQRRRDVSLISVWFLIVLFEFDFLLKLGYLQSSEKWKRPEK